MTKELIVKGIIPGKAGGAATIVIIKREDDWEEPHLVPVENGTDVAAILADVQGDLAQVGRPSGDPEGPVGPWPPLSAEDIGALVASFS